MFLKVFQFSEGWQLAIRVLRGNTNDQTTVLDQVKELNKEFGIEEMVFVSDRGMITSKRIPDLEAEEFKRVKYKLALKRKDMMRSVGDNDHPIQLNLFDHENLVEITDKEKRYVLCNNRLKSDEDRATRLRLLANKEDKLQSFAQNVHDNRLKNRDNIARRLYRWINKWNIERFFSVEYAEGFFQYSRNNAEIERYSVLDECYVVMSNVAE